MKIRTFHENAFFPMSNEQYPLRLICQMCLEWYFKYWNLVFTTLILFHILTWYKYLFLEYHFIMLMLKFRPIDRKIHQMPRPSVKIHTYLQKKIFLRPIMTNILSHLQTH